MVDARRAGARGQQVWSSAKKILWLTLAVGFCAAKCQSLSSPTSSRLVVSFGSQGIQTIVYDGVVLEDLSKYPSDAFHIWHMKMSDLKGNLVSDGQHGWGENNNSKQWDASEHAWLYKFTWGSIRVKFVPGPSSLGVDVTESNNADSKVVLEGASLYAMAMHFPMLPRGFENAHYPQLNDDVTSPGVLLADYGSGLLTVVSPSAAKPLYSGLVPAGTDNAYSVLVSSTTPQGLAVFKQHFDRPVRPGETDHFAISLTFSSTKASQPLAVTNAYHDWAKTFPATLKWKDRRPIGTVYLASSASGDANHPHGFANNPRRYFNEEHSDVFNVYTAEGTKQFQKRVLDQAAAVVLNLKKMNAQAAITWDIEGEEYPQQTSYVCSPDQVAELTPEMEKVVEDSGSSFAGMKLDDAYFKTIRDGGFRVGVCVRPQHFIRSNDGSAQQAYLPTDRIAAELIRKMKYAHDRWGATVFYLDSTVEQNGTVLNPDILKRASAAMPDCLLIPEESTVRDYGDTAPFHDFLFHGSLGTDATIRGYYPGAFSAILINDVDTEKLIEAQAELTKAVAHGDVLMIHADYWPENNTLVQHMYSTAHK